jgi:uncharacterized protein (DUF58 family)
VRGGVAHRTSGAAAATRAALGKALPALRTIWHRIRWRRISFTSGGVAFTIGTFAVGFAAMNTGNNLLYLLWGSMLGFLMVSFWLSEQAIRDVRIERRFARAVTVGHDFRLSYEVTNRKSRLPSLALEIIEGGLPGRAFVAHVPPGGTVAARSVNSFVRRGIYPLDIVTLSTAFPFGLFRKEKDIRMPGEVVVWPRSDRRVREPRVGGGRMRRAGLAARGTAGSRGEYRSLRGYRPGDDPKDIHWRSTARLREPVIREYERDGAETRWICLDTRVEQSDAAEVAVEVAASLCAQAVVARTRSRSSPARGCWSRGRAPPTSSARSTCWHAWTFAKTSRCRHRPSPGTGACSWGSTRGAGSRTSWPWDRRPASLAGVR